MFKNQIKASENEMKYIDAEMSKEDQYCTLDEEI